ncbi:MAG: ABC transporter permease [Clostridium argentinense]|uniref:ABC transporter permease n=1 Tax=Clostridium faecium TaxID=2762223 RepID=A0ABR8YUH6_9CLOT|nr:MULTISPECIES: ABC transporter permease [Clostridium]MBD8047917.1 ABC transporter permease [Clostridium faecium]MBS5822519.1 ABC transporter permease [Clostridium argentinense]MDU1347958.1 ABC transporter permease [Clostridium argentinense]
MNSLDIVKMGLKNLWRRKLRTFLTILGVIIGTSSIITMLSLGFGMTESFKNNISQMGSLNTITVYEDFGGNGPEGNVVANKKKVYLNDEAISNISKINGVELATGVMDLQVKLNKGRYTAYATMRGMDTKAMEAFEFNAEEGRILKVGDNYQCVWGGELKNYFFDEKSSGYGMPPEINPMKDHITMEFNVYDAEGKPKKMKKPIKINTVGVLKSGDYEKDGYIFTSLEYVKKLQKEQEKLDTVNKNKPKSKNKYQQILVKVNDINKIADIQKQIKDMGYGAFSLNDILDNVKSTMNIMQAILGGIGAISLLVAAIGIANTMIMSIYERTREIGVMKVIGAQLKDIRRIFLFEAGMIGLSGGIFGIGLSYLLSVILNIVGANINLFGDMGPDAKLSIIPLWLTIAALIFSTLVGLMSGFYPAKRAMKLSALEAIKTE